jgi:serine/threonine protein kinase
MLTLVWLRVRVCVFTFMVVCLLADKFHLMCRAAACLCEVHDAGYIHRDVKPGNFLCNKSKYGDILDVKIADFGLSSKKKNCARNVGTRSYTAPEVLKAVLYDTKVRIIMLYVSAE